MQCRIRKTEVILVTNQSTANNLRSQVKLKKEGNLLDTHLKIAVQSVNVMKRRSMDVIKANLILRINISIWATARPPLP